MTGMRAKNGTAYEWTGTAGNPVVVLIHGLGLTRNTWDAFLNPLADAYRVLTYDLFGHGESAMPPRKPDLSLYARQLYELLVECEVEQVTLIGFSLGGMINRRFVMDYPDMVRGLVILNSPHERSAEAQSLVEQRAADTHAGGPAATIDATIARWFTESFIDRQGETIQKIRDWVLANDPEAYAQCRQVLAHGVLELIRPDPPIGHPALIMTCEFDSGSTPQMSVAIAQEMVQAETVIVPGLQHMGLVEQPQLFLNPILDFMNRLSSSNTKR